RLTPDAIALLSQAIQSKSKELKVQGDGPTLKLGKTADMYASEINLNGSKARIHLTDKMQIGAVEDNAPSTGVKVMPAKRGRRYARELSEKAAEMLSVEDFSIWTLLVFGSDIDTEACKTLHRNLRAKSFPNPKLVLSSAGSLGGEFGVYNNPKREIHVSKD